jgi:hypothetical protein
VRSRFAPFGIAALLLVAGSAGIAAPAPVDSTSTDATDFACTPPQGPVDRPDYCSYPADIRDFIDVRDSCDHWRGEPWATDEEIHNESDPLNREIAIARRKEIFDAIKESCTGTDKRLAALKAAYAGNPKILQLLDEYETDIEPND